MQWDFNYSVSISKDVNGDALVQNGERRVYMNEYDDIGGVTYLHDNNGNLTDDGAYLYTCD